MPAWEQLDLPTTGDWDLSVQRLEFEELVVLAVCLQPSRA
jgi:hypothetical protein